MLYTGKDVRFVEARSSLGREGNHEMKSLGRFFSLLTDISFLFAEIPAQKCYDRSVERIATYEDGSSSRRNNKEEYCR
jgi:hypothetical protein